MSRVVPLVLSLIVTLWCSGPASAHFLWLATEPQQYPSKVKLFFGEAAEADDPALLDRVRTAEIWAVNSKGEATAIELAKADDSLEASLPPGGPPAAVILRHVYGALTKGGESFLLKYYGKTYPSALPGLWHQVGDKERLPLEITPQQTDGATLLKVTWLGKPLAGAVLTLVGPGIEEKREIAAGDDGICRCSLSQTGLYSIRVRHVENAPGKHGGKAYQTVRHYSTLALRFEPSKLSPSPASFPPLPRGVTSFGGAVAGDSLCIYGGNYGSAHDYSKEDQSGDLWRLDLAHPEKWERLQGGPKLQGLAMVEYQGRLYRVGGFSAQNQEGEELVLRSQADFARYSFDSQAWQALPALPEPRSSHDAAVVGDSLYVVGGWNMQGRGADAKWHDTALVVNLASDVLEWKPIAPPPFKRRALALAACGDKLCVIGGMQEQGGPTTAVAVYDPQKDAWSDGTRLPGAGIEGFGASAFACDGAIYITTLSGAIQRLSRGGENWEFLGQLEHPRFFHRLLPWGDNRLVVVGGGNMTSGKAVELELLSVVKQ